jgi:hypothetical protein
MRTTVTLDADVERLLKNEAHRRGGSFKTALNEAVRRAFRPGPHAAAAQPFVVKAKAMGLRPEIDPARLSELADEMETDAFLAGTRRLAKKGK